MDFNAPLVVFSDSFDKQQLDLHPVNLRNF